MMIVLKIWRFCLLVLTITEISKGQDDAQGSNDYNVQHNDGSFEFGYDTKDHFHHADGTKANFVRGQFGSRNPGTGAIDTTSYTAGPRGFRPRGKNIHRKYDLSQVGPRPIGSKDDPYYDTNEDPSYNFKFRTRTYNRQEAANRVGDVTGKYSFIDDVGEQHTVEYIAGKNTGFHVRTPYPDSNPRATGPLFYQGPGKIPRGRTSIQRELDGSYRFVSAGPDQRRTEQSDASGHVRGSYTFIDDKGTQHTVHYIAGPETGYRVLKNVKGPHFPNWYPFGLGRPGYPIPDYNDDFADKPIEDIFGDPKEHLNTAASGHVKPPKTFGSRGGGGAAGSGSKSDDGGFGEKDKSDEFDDTFSDNFGKSKAPKKPSFYTPAVTRRPFGGPKKPFLDDDGGFSSGGSDDNFDDDLFKPSASGGSTKPSKGESDRKPDVTPGSPRSTTTSSLFGDELSTSNDDFDLFGGGGSGNRGGGSKDRVGGGGGGSSNRGGGGSNRGGDSDNRRGGGGSSISGGRKETPASFDNDDIGDEEPVRIGATFDGKATILKNIGDKFISLSPGIAVRAHVQSIDILPYGSRLPSPSEQLKAESSNIEEQEHIRKKN